MPKKVYIAGPYTKPEPCVNTHNTIMVAEEIVKQGHTPYIPHLNLLWHIVVPHEADFWYAYDLEWLIVCDILLRMPGESVGADHEVNFAIKNGIPVVFSMDELKGVLEYGDRKKTQEWN